MTTSRPSRMSSAAMDVFAPSETPIFTGAGRTNSPSVTQTTPCDGLGFLSDVAGLGSPGGSSCAWPAGFQERQSGATWASEDGDHRSAELGTRSVFDSLLTSKRTFAVR